MRTAPKMLMKKAQQDAKARWQLYEQMAAMHYGADGNGKKPTVAAT